MALVQGEHERRYDPTTTLELGYWLAEPWWGLGIMNTAVQQFLKFMLDPGLMGEKKLPWISRLQTLVALAALDNPASTRIIEKNCFKEVESILVRRQAHPV